jgi:hypothetical protein
MVGWPTVESGLTLDINRLLRQRNIVPGNHVSGRLIWSNTATGKEVASIGYEASLVDPYDTWVRLHYSANGAPKDYRVRLVTSPAIMVAVGGGGDVRDRDARWLNSICRPARRSFRVPHIHLGMNYSATARKF